MKIMVRMLASILPGIIVGLGVIAYLEREHLQEKWDLFSEDRVEHEADEQDEPYLRRTPIAVFPPSSSIEKRAAHRPSADVEQRDLHERDHVEAAAPAIVAEREPVTAKTPVTAKAPVINKAPLTQEAPATVQNQAVEVLREQPVAEHLSPSSRPQGLAEQAAESLKGRERSPTPDLSTVLQINTQDDPQSASLPAPLPLEPQYTLSDQVAALSKPMETLAQQFNPVAPSTTGAQPNTAANKRDIWRVDDTLEAETELQWLWNRGRQAFWEGDYDQAIESYRSLLQEEPKNPDAWGELGNIYYAKKDWVRAVRAFGRAAAALTQQGKVAEAEKIMTVIRGIDPQLAEKLSADLSLQF